MRRTLMLDRLRNSRGCRLMIAVFAVPAILVGLLAMHVLTTTGLDETGTSASHTAHHADAKSLADAAAGSMVMSALNTDQRAPSPDGCAGPCGPSHSMLSMICVLALLVTVLLFTVQLILTGWRSVRPMVATLIASTAVLLAPPPPSLTLLSISRT